MWIFQNSTNTVLVYLKLLRGAMGEISVTLVKNFYFILFHKFNIHKLIYDYMKFQTYVTEVQSFMRPYVNFYAI